MALKIRSLRAPRSYTTGGDTYTLGEYEYLAYGSGVIGRKILVQTVSSSPYIPQPVSHSGNIVTIMLRDTRAGGAEAASTTDVSNLDLAILYEGY